MPIKIKLSKNPLRRFRGADKCFNFDDFELRDEQYTQDRIDEERRDFRQQDQFPEDFNEQDKERFNEQFEKELAEFISVNFCATVNSGSSANLAAFSALTSEKLGDKRLKP